MSALGGVAALLFVAGWIPLLAGVILAVVGGIMRQRTTVIGKARQLSCAEVRAGQGRGARIRVQGHTVPGPNGLLRAPLTGAACVSWRHEIGYLYFAATGSDSMRDGRETAWMSVSGPYPVADSTGQILIDPLLPEGALGTLYDRVFEEEYLAADPGWYQRTALAHLLRTGELSVDVITPPRSRANWSAYYTLREHVIPAGRAVFAHGMVGGELGGVPLLSGTGVPHARVSTGPLVEPERRAAGWGLGCAGALVAIGFVMFVVALAIVALAGRIS